MEENDGKDIIKIPTYVYEKIARKTNDPDKAIFNEIEKFIKDQSSK